MRHLLRMALLLIILVGGCGGEPGLLRVCWVGGTADYSGDCEDLMWNRSLIPLKVYIDLPSSFSDSVRKGYEMWNDEVGPLFTFVGPGAGPRVHVYQGSATGTTGNQAMHHDGVSGTGATSAIHEVRQPGNLFALFHDAAHEAGHVLGLAHDDSGLMVPTWTYSGNIEFVLPSDSDAELLYDLYLR